MNDQSRDATNEVAEELTRLKLNATDARTVLGRMQQESIESDTFLASSSAARLVATNERLVLSMLRARAESEDAARTLIAVARSAETDPLTGLPNRTLLNDRFAQAIANARRHETRLALLFIDLDGFKQINDSLGHAVGDEVLKVVARGLKQAVRATDTVCRDGGDEFLVLLSDIAEPADAAITAEKVIAQLSAPSRVGTHVLQLSASIGISLYPDEGEDPETIIANADSAMYRAKRHAPGSFAFFHSAPTVAATTSGEEGETRLLTKAELVIAEHERWHADLREANEKLVLSSLESRERQLVAELEQQRLRAELTNLRATLQQSGRQQRA